MSTSTLSAAEEFAREFAEGRVRPATIDQVASLGIVGRTRLYAGVRSGEIRSIPVGQRRLIPADEVRRLLGLEVAK